MGAASVGLVVLGFLPVRGSVSEAAPALLLVVPVVVAGVIGGRVAAAATGVLATAALNLAFIKPYGNPSVALLSDTIALIAFFVIALAIGALAAIEADRRRAAEQRAGELEALNQRLAEVSQDRERLATEARRVEVLEEIDEQRGALLRSVSHDLRTPLATIRAVTSDLRAGADYDRATQRELLDLVGDETERLDRLVANLLSLSRIEAGALKPDRQAVALDELVEERVRHLGRLFSQVRLVVDIPDDLPLVDGDYSQLDQVVTNLLENAARHAPPKSALTISAAATPSGWVEVRVADEGIGVADHERARIFHAFQRGEGSRSSGIGLAICKAIVEAHGGRIDVERTPGGGATFVFTLPTRKHVHG